VNPEVNSEQESETTRQKFREKLRSGSLDERMVELELSAITNADDAMMGPFNMEEMGINCRKCSVIFFLKKKNAAK